MCAPIQRLVYRKSEGQEGSTFSRERPFPCLTTCTRPTAPPSAWCGIVLPQLLPIFISKEAFNVPILCLVNLMTICFLPHYCNFFSPCPLRLRTVVFPPSSSIVGFPFLFSFLVTSLPSALPTILLPGDRFPKFKIDLINVLPWGGEGRGCHTPPNGQKFVRMDGWMVSRPRRCSPSPLLPCSPLARRAPPGP